MFRVKIKKYKKDSNFNEHPFIEYTLNGTIHRDDGPAIEFINGNKYWFVNGNLHRLNEPAIERTNGNDEWWVNGGCIKVKHV